MKKGELRPQQIGRLRWRETDSGALLDRFRDWAVIAASGVIYPPAAYATLIAVFGVLVLVSLISSDLVPETRGEPVWEANSDLG